MRDEIPTAQSQSTLHESRVTFGKELQLRIHGPTASPTLIHLPGLHGDWTLLAPFRQALGNRARFVETTYPREPNWQLVDYATAVESTLLERGITSGWILGESFSSQVTWTFLHRQRQPGCTTRFQVEGLILVGGFVRHPWPWGVRLAHAASKYIPLRMLRQLCQFYAQTMSKRFPSCPEAVAEFAEFIENRANALDRDVITRRYLLIAGNQPGTIARAVTIPVYHLSGAWDPIVPWWHVRPWLRKNCPGYRASRIIRSGDHNVLLSSPKESAEQILAWVGEISGSTA